MAVTLINVFMVPADKQEEFLATWKQTSSHFEKSAADSGFIETHLHRNTGVGNQTFAFINIARWKSADHWKNAHDAYSPKEYLIPGVKGHPAIFESVVDVYSSNHVGSRESVLTIPQR